MSDFLDLLGSVGDLVWNISQDRKMSALQDEVKQLKEAARSSDESDPIQVQLKELRAAHGELRLYVATLFRLLLHKGVITRDEVVKLVGEVDEEDGKRDQSHEGRMLP
jgi:hypothetical protein